MVGMKKGMRQLIVVAAVGISSIVLLAAYGKWFHPAELLMGWDRTISLFELLFVVFLLYFRNSWTMWMIAAVIFAAWGGYASCWCQVHLPCHCMGVNLRIPTVLSVFLDGVFFVLALYFVYVLGKSKRRVYLTLLLAVLGVVLGWVVSSSIYKQII